MSQLTIDYPYAGFTLEIIVDACEGRAQTQIDPEEPAEFIIEEIKLDGKCAKELINWEEWPEYEQINFEQSVEAHYVEATQ